MVFSSENIGSLLREADEMRLSATIDDNFLSIVIDGDAVIGQCDADDNVIFGIASVATAYRIVRASAAGASR